MVTASQEVLGSPDLLRIILGAMRNAEGCTCLPYASVCKAFMHALRSSTYLACVASYGSQCPASSNSSHPHWQDLMRCTCRACRVQPLLRLYGDRPLHLAVDTKGHISIPDHDHARLLIFSPDGPDQIQCVSVPCEDTDAFEDTTEGPDTSEGEHPLNRDPQSVEALEEAARQHNCWLSCAPRSMALTEDGFAWVIIGDLTTALLRRPISASTRGRARAIERALECYEHGEPPSAILETILDDHGFVEHAKMMKMVGGTIRLPGCDILNDVISAADGSIFVSAEAEGKILVLDGATGEVQRVIGETGHRAGQLRSPNGMALHNGRLFAADTANHRVEVYRYSDGAHLQSIGRCGHEPWPEWDEEDGQYRVVAGWDEDGEEILTDDSRIGDGGGEFNEPLALAIGHGRLYVVEGAGGGNRLQVLTLEGKPLQVLRNPRLQDPLVGVCVRDEHVWVLTTPHYEEIRAHISESGQIIHGRSWIPDGFRPLHKFRARQARS